VRYRVLSKRMRFPQGAVVEASDLSGNIDVLVQAGHLAPVLESSKKKVKPEEPVSDAADQPEEQD